MKRFTTLCVAVVALLFSAATYAQKASELVYTDVKEAIEKGTIKIMGKGFDNGCDSLFYTRLPKELDGNVRQAVWDLGKNSAGVAIRFRTNAKCIGAKWTLINNFSMAHMPGTGIRGLDMYTYYPEQGWQFVGVAQPNGKNSVNVFRRNMNGEYRDYIIYLPLYDGIYKLELGVEEGAEIVTPAVDALLHKNSKKPIVFYGTSVTQGGCASRPGMAYPAILGRMMDRETINLGFSGNGRMDKILADKISTIDAAAFVIDCLGNCTHKIITDSTEYFVKKIAGDNPNTPVYMVSNYSYPYQHCDEQFRKDLANENALWLAMHNKLRKEGYKNVHFINLSGGKITPQEGDVKFTDNPKSNLKNLGGNIKKGAIGPDTEGTVDGVHLTDLGFLRKAKLFYKELNGVK